ncbi:hypothetical protein [Streptomyces sp. NPDC051563]|uniref:hypothetical protein n=1 Tax=Streptomyces sp. NPDC051563 TaxID=3365659 RepID=UPI0037AF0AFE
MSTYKSGSGPEDKSVADGEEQVEQAVAAAAEEAQARLPQQPGACVPGQDQCSVPVPVPVPGTARPSLLRRVMRKRTVRTAVVGLAVGALLGAGAVGWRTGTLPLLGPAPCWDSMSDSTMTDLFGDRRTEVEEQKLRPDPRGRGLAYGQCRITSYKGDEARRQLTVRVHRLDGFYGSDARQWPEEFLAAGMVALGDGLPGMVSSSRAWLPVPQSCTGRPGQFEGPVVVDVAMGSAGLDIESEYEQEDRAALARAVVDATNGVTRDLGCSGAYPAPHPTRAPAAWQSMQPELFCGMKGLSLPTEYRGGLARTRISGEGAPARVCEAAGDIPRAVVRMTTVVDPTLADVFSQDVLKGGSSIKGSSGYGSFSETRAVYRAQCQTGAVIYVFEQKDRAEKVGFTLLRALMPAYIEAESERIGCGPEQVVMSRP